jgi:hypothetical protein
MTEVRRRDVRSPSGILDAEEGTDFGVAAAAAALKTAMNCCSAT